MLLWPAVTLLGFFLITAAVIAMGAQTTARYEREQRDGGTVPQRHTAAEPIGAVGV